MPADKADSEKGSGAHVSGQSNKPLSRPAHALTHHELANELGADPLAGLTTAEAKRRHEEYGANDLGEGEGVQPLKIVIAQVANAMTMVSMISCGFPHSSASLEHSSPGPGLATKARDGRAPRSVSRIFFWSNWGSATARALGAA